MHRRQPCRMVSARSANRACAAGGSLTYQQLDACLCLLRPGSCAGFVAGKVTKHKAGTAAPDSGDGPMPRRRTDAVMQTPQSVPHQPTAWKYSGLGLETLRAESTVAVKLGSYNVPETGLQFVA